MYYSSYEQPAPPQPRGSGVTIMTISLDCRSPLIASLAMTILTKTWTKLYCTRFKPSSVSPSGATQPKRKDWTSRFLKPGGLKATEDAVRHLPIAKGVNPWKRKKIVPLRGAGNLGMPNNNIHNFPVVGALSLVLC